MDYHDHLVRAFSRWHCLGIPAEAFNWRRCERCVYSLGDILLAMISGYVTMMGYDAFPYHFSICIGRLFELRTHALISVYNIAGMLADEGS